MQDLGFDVDGWDFGDNKPSDCVSKLMPIYDVVYASNVLNVISSESMLTETLDQIYGCLKNDGIFIANYPQSPRKMRMSNKELSDIIGAKFDGMMFSISNTSTPMWVFTKQYVKVVAM